MIDGGAAVASRISPGVNAESSEFSSARAKLDSPGALQPATDGKHAAQHIGRHIHPCTLRGLLDRVLFPTRNSDLQLPSLRFLAHGQSILRCATDVNTAVLT